MVALLPKKRSRFGRVGMVLVETDRPSDEAEINCYKAYPLRYNYSSLLYGEKTERCVYLCGVCMSERIIDKNSYCVSAS